MSDSQSHPPEKPHYAGHRDRLRQRFLKSDGEGVADYELLEMLLFAARTRGDVKPVAKALLQHFGSFSKVIHAQPQELEAVKGMGKAGAAAIRAVKATMVRSLQDELMYKQVLSHWSQVIDYCRTKLGHEPVESFFILFLNHKNHLLADEVQQTGTVNHTPVYIREVIKRALELGAGAMVLAHNHPSGDPKPSKADLQMTLELQAAAAAMGIDIHDHVIVTATEHYSFRGSGVL